MRVLAILLCLFLIPFALVAQDTTSCSQLSSDLNGDLQIGVADLVILLGGLGINLDLDGDMVPDCNDDCVGGYDECGICNGPGPQFLVLDTIIITYDSIYVDAINDWVTYELGVDSVFTLQCDEPDSFISCGDPMALDGFNYSTIQIGDQCWFAENLRTTVYGNGEAVPTGLTDGEWEITTSGAMAIYGEVSSSCQEYSPDIDACDEAESLEEYGRLYNWYAVDDARGLCPVGWHVPTDGEWTELENYISAQGFSGTEGVALKSTTGWYNDGNGTNDFGFSALPGGVRYNSDGSFYDAGLVVRWWSSSSIGGNAWSRYLKYSYPDIDRNDYNSRGGLSVRCLRDAE